MKRFADTVQRSEPSCEWSEGGKQRNSVVSHSVVATYFASVANKKKTKALIYATRQQNEGKGDANNNKLSAIKRFAALCPKPERPQGEPNIGSRWT